MSNNIINTTGSVTQSSGEDPKKINQEKGSKKRFSSHHTADNLLHDNKHSEYDSISLTSHQQQPPPHHHLYGELFSQQNISPKDHGNNILLALPFDCSISSSTSLDCTELYIPVKDFVSDNYASESLDHYGAATAGGTADTILQPSRGTEENNCNGVHPHLNTPRSLKKISRRSYNSLQGGGVLTSSNGHDSGWRHINKSKLWNNKVSKDFIPEKLSSFFEGEEDVEVRQAADTLHSGDIDGNKRPNAFFSGSNSEEVMPFLHGDEVSKVFNHFNDLNHASNWSNKYFNGSHGRGTCANASGYSATAVVRTNINDEVVVVVTKEDYIKYGESEGIKKSHKTDKPIAPTPYFPSTFQPTVESISHDWCASAAMASFLKELNEKGTMIPTISPVVWAMNNHLEYRRRLPNMSREERITFLEKGCAKFIELLVDVLGSVKGGKYLWFSTEYKAYRWFFTSLCDH